MAQTSHIARAEESHALELNASLEHEENEFTITLHIHLDWKTDYDIYEYLLLSRTARYELYHYISHIQELFPEKVYISHSTFAESLEFKIETQDDLFVRKLRKLVHHHPLHVNKTSATSTHA